ncbi:MAG: hypothetical protein IPG70_07050 [Moraxellaceae bacterium]|nr:hypothetical protein [Moraxellaceae bacterium]
MAENAEKLQQQGLDDQDVYLLRQAAGLYGQLGNSAQQSYCLAEIQYAYLANIMSDACQFWELSKEQYKIIPPFPRYAEAVVVARPFPANLDALVSLKKHEQLYQSFSDYQDISKLSLKSWQLVLDTLFTTLTRQQIVSLLDTKLLTLRNLAFMDTLIVRSAP